MSFTEGAADQMCIIGQTTKHKIKTAEVTS